MGEAPLCNRDDIKTETGDVFLDKAQEHQKWMNSYYNN